MTLEVIDRLEARYQQSVRDFATLPKAPPGYTA
jgi:FtsZ-binding cell division protein ZapB